MKNLLLLLFTLLIAWPMFAQQESYNFFQDENNFQQNPQLLSHTYLEQNHEIFRHGVMDFHQPIILSTEVATQIDSLIIVHEDRTTKELYSYDANGNLLTKLIQNWENGSWVNWLKSIYTYNTNGLLLIRLTQVWTNDTWVNYWIYTHNYDNNSNLLTSLLQSWQNESWLNSQFTTSTYDANGNVLTYLFQYWEDGAWANSSLTTSTYNANCNILTYYSQNWENGVWVGHSLTTNTYNNNGDRQTTLRQELENSILVNSTLFTQTYDDNGNRLSGLYQKWQNGLWVNYSFTTYTYNSYGILLSRFQQVWENGVWVNYVTTTFMYDENGDLLTQFSQYWTNSTWQNSMMKSYIYDSNRNRLSTIDQFWEYSIWQNIRKTECIFLPGQINATAYEWDDNNWGVNQEDNYIEVIIGGQTIISIVCISLELYFTDVISIDEQNEIFENETIHCFPNPATGQLNIEINPAWLAETCVVELFNQSGQKLKSLEFSPNSNTATVSLNVEDVPPGLYLLKVSSDQKTSTRKVIIE